MRVEIEIELLGDFRTATQMCDCGIGYATRLSLHRLQKLMHLKR
jgi:hypothetical protein